MVKVPPSVRTPLISARREALNAADVAFLCLPDAAAVEAVSLVESPDTVVIDTSTAHRTADGWEYGFPELAGRRERIAASATVVRFSTPTGTHCRIEDVVVDERLRGNGLA